jgi:hypothetical protein
VVGNEAVIRYIFDWVAQNRLLPELDSRTCSQLAICIVVARPGGGPLAEYLVAYEYPTRWGNLRLASSGGRWAIEFNGCLHGQWPSPDAAAMAAARHRTGLQKWDQSPLVASDDLLRWRPIGNSL